VVLVWCVVAFGGPHPTQGQQPVGDPLDPQSRGGSAGGDRRGDLLQDPVQLVAGHGRPGGQHQQLGRLCGVGLNDQSGALYQQGAGGGRVPIPARSRRRGGLCGPAPRRLPAPARPGPAAPGLGDVAGLPLVLGGGQPPRPSRRLWVSAAAAQGGRAGPPWRRARSAEPSMVATCSSGPEGGGGQVPGPPVGPATPLEHLDQGPVGGPPAEHCGLLVDGRADQRKAKHRLGVHHLDQPGLLGRLPALLVNAQLTLAARMVTSSPVFSTAATSSNRWVAWGSRCTRSRKARCSRALSGSRAGNGACRSAADWSRVSAAPAAPAGYRRSRGSAGHGPPGPAYP
jgi:hypothetical protein